MARPTLPDTASIGDAGHVTDHNGLVAAIQNLYDYSVEITHPNTDDVRVRVHDGDAWQTTHYDSGRRDISGLMPANWAGPDDTTTRIRRVNEQVELQLTLNGSVIGTGTNVDFFTIPAGFRPSWSYLMPMWYVSADITKTDRWYSASNVLRCSSITSALATNSRVKFIWMTADAIPASLPGTLLSAAPA
jgi:hypothetical protein